jgi:hypothetical protein
LQCDAQQESGPRQQFWCRHLPPRSSSVSHTHTPIEKHIYLSDALLAKCVHWQCFKASVKPVALLVDSLACSYHAVIANEFGVNVLDSAASAGVAGDCMELNPCGKIGSVKFFY